MIPFVEWIVFKTRPTIVVVIAVILSFGGVSLITLHGQLTFGYGDGLILVAAVLRACMVTYTKKNVANFSVSTVALTCVQSGVVGFGAIILALLLLSKDALSFPQENEFWMNTIYLVIFCTVFAFFAQNYALRRSNPTRVSLLMGTEPLFGAMFAVFWLDEQLTAIIWFGGFLIILGSLLGTIFDKRSTN